MGSAFSWQDDTVTFTPEGDGFARAGDYEVTVGTEAREPALPEPGGRIQFSFTVAGYLDVVNVQPAPGSEDVPTDGVIMVQFGRPVVPLTLRTRGGTSPTPSSAGSGGRRQMAQHSIYTFKPDQGFEPATGNSGRRGGGLKDATGAILARDYTGRASRGRRRW